MDGSEDKPIWLSVVVPTTSGPEYWQRHKKHWQDLREQWPHFKLILVSSSTRLDSTIDWVQFVFSGKTMPMARRFLGFSIAQTPYSLFLDDDCTVEKDVLVTLVNQMRISSGSTLLAGRYLSPASLSNGGKAFNELCNKWLESGPHFLGGAFCLPNSDFMHGVSFGDIADYGGEEDRMAQEVLDRGGRILFCPEFCVQHHSEKSFMQFVERAFRHGRNWQPRLTASVSLPRRLLSAHLREWPWLVSHGAGLVIGAAVGRIEKLVK